MIVALDWDNTLVDKEQEWLPGALDGLRWLRRNGHKVVIHSCRANSDYGWTQINAKLVKHKLNFPIERKVEADLYIDDKALRFTRWPEAIKGVRNATP